MPSQILLVGGRLEDEDDLEVLELWQQEEAETSEESEEEDGPGPPSRKFRLFFCLFFCLSFVLIYGSEDEGSGWGSPTMTAQAGPG